MREPPDEVRSAVVTFVELVDKTRAAQDSKTNRPSARTESQTKIEPVGSSYVSQGNTSVKKEEEVGEWCAGNKSKKS